MDDILEARKYIAEAATRLLRLYGGQWGEHPSYSSEAWRNEAFNEDTRLGYWEWVCSQIEADGGEV